MRIFLVHFLALLLGFQTWVAAADVHELHLNIADHHKLTVHEDLSLFNPVPDLSTQDTGDNGDCQHCCHCHGGHSLSVISQNSSFEAPMLASFGYSNLMALDSRYTSSLFRPPIV